MLLVVVAALVVVAIAFIAIGREVSRLESRVAPSVFEVEEAIEFIADRLPESVAARISHDDVRWVLMADAESLEAATAEEVAEGDDDEVVDEDTAIARVLLRAEEERPELTDDDVAAVLDGRMAYLRAIGAIGQAAD